MLSIFLLRISCLCFSQTCIWDVASREMRAECLIDMGEMGKAIGDLKATSKLKNDNTQAFYKLSTIYYTLGDHEMSLKWDTSLSGDWRVLQVLKPFLTVQWGARVPETGSRPQAVLQPLQESQKAQQADSVRRGTDPGAEVGVQFHFHVPHIHTLHNYIWPIRWRVTVPLAQAYCVRSWLELSLQRWMRMRLFTYMISDYILEVFVCSKYW